MKRRAENCGGAFKRAVDHYLGDCKRTGREPQKPASGKLMVLIEPAVHARIGIAAALPNESINQ
ncbi:toxin-antitoxin system HicB family antitoxin [Burkholderia ambifaria]|uniref:toxin-antitoxin system HicB family antitoxin n=1 Tax=Burkholderia ambifaria TaxID=152480 RepID=UPI0009D950A4|nr:toxin-antitoxin system HicB family antitoxin [Burkholderia ambifaria]